jgi:hypothetical protein
MIKFLVTNRIGHRIQSVRLKVVCLARDGERTGVVELWQFNPDVRRRGPEHSHIKRCIVGNQDVLANEGQH